MTRPLLGAMRSHACGSLRAGDAGTEVRLAGWVARRRDHGGVAFLDLRDASGVVQVVVRPDETPAAAAIRTEDCVRVAGTVRARPAGNENPELPTGEVEVAAADVEVLATSETRRSRWRVAATPTRPCASSTATWTCAGPRPGAAWRSGPRPTRPCAGSWPTAGSWRSRPRT